MLFAASVPSLHVHYVNCPVLQESLNTGAFRQPGDPWATPLTLLPLTLKKIYQTTFQIYQTTFQVKFYVTNRTVKKSSCGIN